MSDEPVSLAQLSGSMAVALQRMSDWQQTPEGRETIAREERARERRRLDELNALADLCGAPAQREVRAAALAPHPVGPFIDAAREVFTYARGKAPAHRGKTPAFRVLLSAPGVGKSVALTFAIVNAPRGAAYATAAEIARTHRAMHDNRGAWQRWVNVDLLCIDELGVEEKPEVVSELLLDRWTAGGLTLCAGNIGSKQLAARYFGGELGARLKDRLNDQVANGLSVLVQRDDESRRAKPVKPAKVST